MLTVKKHSKSDFYETYSKWAIAHNFPVMGIEVLPENFFVCYNEDLPIYAMPFWFTDSKISIIAFVISNKGVNHKKRIGGLDFLIGGMLKYAKRKKSLLVYSNTTTKVVADSLLKNGFDKGDENSGQYFKKI